MSELPAEKRHVRLVRTGTDGLLEIVWGGSVVLRLTEEEATSLRLAISASLGMSPQADERLRARLWARVDKSGGPDACWPWTGGGRANGGYGKLSAYGKQARAHRLAYELTPATHADNGRDRCPSCTAERLRDVSRQASARRRASIVDAAGVVLAVASLWATGAMAWVIS